MISNCVFECSMCALAFLQPLYNLCLIHNVMHWRRWCILHRYNQPIRRLIDIGNPVTKVNVIVLKHICRCATKILFHFVAVVESAE